MPKKYSHTDYTATCESCDWWANDASSISKARNHCKKTGHTAYCDKIVNTRFVHDALEDS